jgi:hypothetical protein
MIIKSTRNIAGNDIELLNRVKHPVFKYNDAFMSKVASHENLSLVRTANKDDVDKAVKSLQHPENFDLAKDIEEHPDNLYVRALAIVADEPNDNGDYFSEEVLKDYFHTFVGCPLFVNHKNDDVEEARGTIIHAEWSDEEHGIITIGRVDAKAYPKLARGIAEGYITGVSMGCQVEYSRCSICDNKAVKEDDYCSHIKEHKTRELNGKKVYEENYGIKFIELSFVVDPACSQCHIQEIFDIEDFQQKVANISSDLKKVAKSIHGRQIAKLSGKAEIEKLNQAESLMQEVAKAMLDQKQYLQLEYVSDLVEAMAKLQETKDELIDMGYESVPSAGETPSVPEAPTNLPPEGGQNLEEENLGNITQAPAGDVGSVTMPGAMANSLRNGFIKSIASEIGNKHSSEDGTFDKIVRDNLKNQWNKE